MIGLGLIAMLATLDAKPESEPKADASPYALVIARTVDQRDPIPAACGPDGSCGDSIFLGRFAQARVIAGRPLPVNFEARIKFHTPLITPVPLAMIVERKPNGELLVRRRAGFNDRTGTACFIEPDEEAVDWKPIAQKVTDKNGVICVRDE